MQLHILPYRCNVQLYGVPQKLIVELQHHLHYPATLPGDSRMTISTTRSSKTAWLIGLSTQGHKQRHKKLTSCCSGGTSKPTKQSVCCYLFLSVRCLVIATPPHCNLKQLRSCQLQSLWPKCCSQSTYVPVQCVCAVGLCFVVYLSYATVHAVGSYCLPKLVSYYMCNIRG